MLKEIPLTKLKEGQSGKVLRIEGGHNMTHRLSVLGIRPGKTITKTSSVFMRGPVSVKVGHTKVALGFHMANRIMVEV